MKALLTIPLILLSITLSAQNTFKHSLGLDLGYTFNPEPKIDDQIVTNNQGAFTTLSWTFRLFQYKPFHGEMGLAAKTIFSSGVMNDLSFQAITLRIGMPVSIGYRLSEKWTFALGAFLQNNVDLDEFDLRLRDKYSWRMNAVPEIRYHLHTDWTLQLKGHFNVRKMPTTYVIQDPNMGLSLGVSKRIGIVRNK
jgi:hypothetical protein